MFVVSKTFWTLAQPSSVLLLLFATALWRLHKGDTAWGRRGIAVALATAAVVGFTNLATLLIIPLENRFPRPDLSGRPPDGVIMLGGAEDSSGYGQRELMALNEAGERIVETLALARRFPNARIVLSGGTGALFDRNRPAEADLVGRFLLSMGIPADQLLLETRSRTTAENARFVAALGLVKPGERWLLVTSAWHMPRAIGTFRKVGLSVEAFPVDYRTAGVFEPTVLHSNVTDGWRRLDMIVKEYIGLLAYRLTGHSDALLPAP